MLSTNELSELVALQDEEWIKKFFESMSTFFGYAWNNLYPTTRALEQGRKVWHSQLAHYSLETVRNAFKRMVAERPQFPPNLPQFLSLCDAVEGLPPTDDAFMLAMSRKFDCIPVKIAFDKIGSWDFSMLPDKILRQKFAAAYKLAVAQFNRNKRTDRLESASVLLGSDNKAITALLGVDH